MSCGCGDKQVAARDRVVMCDICPWAERGRGLTVKRTALTCTATQRPVVLQASMGECPRHTFDKSDVVLWLGILWYGVPMPVRVWFRLFHPKHPKIRSFTGCGCIKRLKDLFR